MSNHHRRFVLVTPARNEKDFIALTIESVLAQKKRPEMWVIVSDGSVDGTDEIVSSYADRHPFIKLVRNVRSATRNTAAKVGAINLGISALGDIQYDYIGVLDADISFEPHYFEALLDIFDREEKLGVIGGRIYQVGHNGDAVEANSSTESVAGAVQLFRKACFEQIGGYLPIPGGMEDGIAVITARYKGWDTRSIKGLAVLHHRELGTVGRTLYAARFHNGLTEYVVGFGPGYNFIRALSRVPERPVVVGAMLLFCGYWWGFMSGRKILVAPEVVQFMRREHRAKLFSRLRSRRA
jgi:glycosyltransferase involved in cell wall biosynthesis